MIQRRLKPLLQAKWHKGKVILVLGARQVGKSTLLREILREREGVMWLDAENADVPPLFGGATETRLKALFGTYRTLILDEAQKIPNIGSCLKLLADYLPDLQVVATGSSAFELRNHANEPLTGRKWEFHLHPLSFPELVAHHGLLQENRMLNHRLVYGYYPELVVHADEPERRLRELSESYLYRDVLMAEGLQKPEKLVQLLKALALQVGQEVKYHELGKTLGLKNETVEKYIALLEKCFIIFRLSSFSSNQRKELKKGRKIYFCDNGIRNAVIGDFRPWEVRTDQGLLFENFVVSEMKKREEELAVPGNLHFWRTADQQEVDLIIDRQGVLEAYEIKYNPKAKYRLSKTFAGRYPNHSFQLIHRENLNEILIT